MLEKKGEIREENPRSYISSPQFTEADLAPLRSRQVAILQKIQNLETEIAKFGEIQIPLQTKLETKMGNERFRSVKDSPNEDSNLSNLRGNCLTEAWDLNSNSNSNLKPQNLQSLETGES